jgi:hypothetical protein
MQMIHAKFLASDFSPNGAHRPNEMFFSLYQSDKYLETEYKLSAQGLAIANAKVPESCFVLVVLEKAGIDHFANDFYIGIELR